MNEQSSLHNPTSLTLEFYTTSHHILYRCLASSHYWVISLLQCKPRTLFQWDRPNRTAGLVSMSNADKLGWKCTGPALHMIVVYPPGQPTETGFSSYRFSLTWWGKTEIGAGAEGQAYKCNHFQDGSYGGDRDCDGGWVAAGNNASLGAGGRMNQSTNGWMNKRMDIQIRISLRRILWGRGKRKEWGSEPMKHGIFHPDFIHHLSFIEDGISHSLKAQEDGDFHSRTVAMCWWQERLLCICLTYNKCMIVLNSIALFPSLPSIITE